MSQPHLPKAPIQEAVLEIRATLPEEIGPSNLETFAAMAGNYNLRRERIEVAVSLQEPARSTRQVQGLILQQEGAPHIVQARLDGFAFSRLQPYDTWANFRDEARRLWMIYCEVFRPVQAIRLGLRYINSLQVDLPRVPEQTFRILPSIPAPVVPSGINTFTLRLVTEYPDFDATATILEHLPIVPPGAAQATMVLDIDVYKRVALASDNEAIWEHLDALRQLKNFIFFSSLTDEAVARYS